MFTLPQTSIEPKEGVTTEAGLLVIPLTEDSEVLGKLLTWCDPRCLIAMDEQVDIRIALQLVDKYDIDTVAIRAREALRRLSTSSVRQEPMSMYALACKHGFQDIAMHCEGSTKAETVRISLRATTQKRIWSRHLSTL